MNFVSLWCDCSWTSIKNNNHFCANTNANLFLVFFQPWLSNGHQKEHPKKIMWVTANDFKTRYGFRDEHTVFKHSSFVFIRFECGWVISTIFNQFYGIVLFRPCKEHFSWSSVATDLNYAVKKSVRTKHTVYFCASQKTMPHVTETDNPFS